MTRYSQILNKRCFRLLKLKGSRKTALKKCPQKSGICINFLKEVKPKKPNSGRRKVARIRLSTNRIVRAHVNGENAELPAYKRVLIQGKRIRDIPGIQYRVIRGALDMGPVLGRKSSRSKYGIKKEAKIKE